jgi:uncharacterized protein (TIGR03437 family)
MKLLLTLFALSTSAVFAQTPVITTIQNNYARIAEGASNYGIAQGSIFIVKGTNLSAQADTTLQNPPLQTTLANVRVRITMNGVVTYAPIYYVLSFQIAAILPSNIVEGNGTVIIEKNGVNSAPAPLKVVKSAFGMLAWDFETGTGRAIVVKINGTFAGNNASDTGNALNSNDVVLLFGSGLGPITGSDATAPTPTNREDIPISINIGGVEAEVQYRGRSTFAGLDQINVKIPVLAANAYSCNVAMVITTGTNNALANATTIPVAATGTTCTNPNTGGDGGSTNQPTLTQNQINDILGRGNYKVGTVNALRSVVHATVLGQTSTTRADSAFGSFSSITGPDLQNYVNGVLPQGLVYAHGACTVYNGLAIPTGAPNVTTASLDAGASLSLQYPLGTLVMPRKAENGSINYDATPPSVPAGRYTYTGTGGPQVGPFTVGVDVATDLNWTNRLNLLEVTRSAGVTVTWTGGEPGTLMFITGTSSNVTLQGQITASKAFICFANQSAGTFTVPNSITTQMPVTATIDIGMGFPPTVLSPGTLSITAPGKYATTTATGVDIIIATSSTSIVQTTTWK